MIVLWSEDAATDLQHLHDWLSTLEHARPDDVVARIRAAAEAMERLGDIGRPSVIPGLREMSARTDPYVLVYRKEDDVITVLAVYHTAQQR